jgi:hypothetical protein
VSGIGAITAMAGLMELAAVFLARRRAEPPGDAHQVNSPQ